MADKQADADQVAHLQERRIAPGGEDAAKAQIRRDARQIGLARLDHRRERCRFRHDHLPHLEKFRKELHRRNGAVAPAQDVAVEQVPMERRQRADAGPRPVGR